MYKAGNAELCDNYVQTDIPAKFHCEDTGEDGCYTAHQPFRN